MSFNSNSNRSENESLPQQNPIQISAFGLDAMMQRMLITLGLAIIGAFSNEFTYWTNFIANIVQLSWTSFIRASNLSIEVIRTRLGEIINSLIFGGVSAGEILKDVFATICKIFQGALQLTIKLLRGPVQLPTEEFVQDGTLE
jgi:hypothetical protein